MSDNSAGGCFVPGSSSSTNQVLTTPTITSGALTTPTLASPTISGTTTGSGTVTITNVPTANISGTVNYLQSKATLTPTSTITATSGVNAIRGEMDLPSGKTLNGTSFAVGTYGRANIFGTVDIGSGDLAAVYGKMDLNGATLTSGHIAPLQSNIVNPPASASTTVDLVYAESAGGNPINSFFKAFGKSAYVLDVESNTHNQMSTTGTVGTTTAKGWLKVLVEGAVRYIPLADSVS